MATNQKLAEDLLRQVAEWKKGLMYFGGTVLEDYSPDGKKREFCPAQNCPRDPVTRISAELAADRRYAHRLLLSVKGNFLECGFNEFRIHFQAADQKLLESVLSAEAYAGFIQSFREERQKVLAELDRRAHVLRTILTWEWPLTPEKMEELQARELQIRIEEAKELERIHPDEAPTRGGWFNPV